MNVLHLCSEYPPQPVFGLGRYVNELVEALAALGLQIDVFTNSLSGTHHDLTQNGVRVRRAHFPPPPKAPATSTMLMHFNMQLMERVCESAAANKALAEIENSSE